MDNIKSLVPHLDVVLIILVPLGLALVLSRFIHRHMKIPKNMESSRNKTYFSAAQGLISNILYFIALYYILTQLHINVTPLFASAGVIGIIIGLGVRSLIEDFFTGLFILTQDTIRVGDYVEIGGASGITEAVDLRTVRIKDQNGAIHIFPNREVKKIVNYSRRQARVTIDIPIKSNQSIDKATRAMDQALKKIKKNPALGPLIAEGSGVQGIEHIGGSSINIRTLILTKAAFRWDVARQYRYLVLKELAKSKILLA
jgi:small-conductance mechanosensitive channel